MSGFGCHCLFPRAVYNKYLGKVVSVPCGHCSVCRTEHSNRWKTRLEMECSKHKFTCFFTLTFDDEHLPVLDPESVVSCSTTYGKALEASQEYIRHCQGKVPVCTSRPYQLFFKNVRIKLKRLFPDLKDGFLRYFLAHEYGPTTFRPHCHGLLWFDDPRIRSVLKNVVYESWPSASSHKTLSSFFNRNRFKFVGREACGYVAGYLNCMSKLPPLLQEYPFRCTHQQSISEPVGYLPLSSVQVQRLLSGESCKISWKRPSDSSSFEVTPWPVIENRLFPRCVGFHSFNIDDGVRFYNELFNYTNEADFKSFVCKLQSLWFDSVWFVQKIQELLARCSFDVECPSLAVNKSMLRSLYRLYLCGKRYCCNCRKFEGYSFRTIYEYYKRKEYANLCSQLSFQQEVVSRLKDEHTSLEFLPYFIDPCFFNNDRKLDFRVYESYVEQFNVKSHPCSLLHNFSDYLFKRALCNKIQSGNTKVRRKKDYLANHPEYENMYTNLIF